MFGVLQGLSAPSAALKHKILCTSSCYPRASNMQCQCCAGTALTSPSKMVKKSKSGFEIIIKNSAKCCAGFLVVCKCSGSKGLNTHILTFSEPEEIKEVTGKNEIVVLAWDHNRQS